MRAMLAGDGLSSGSVQSPVYMHRTLPERFAELYLRTARFRWTIPPDHRPSRWRGWNLFELCHVNRYLEAVPGVEVLVLHGPPGSGKTTLSRAIAEILRMAGVPHAVIDLDELSNVFPHPRRSFARENLQAIWPNYAAIPHLKIVIPSVIADQEEREQLRDATPGAQFLVCELTAPESVLKDRVTAREPNEFWRTRLRKFVDLYHRRTDLPQIRNFQVNTHGCTVEEAARQVVEMASWGSAPRQDK